MADASDVPDTTDAPHAAEPVRVNGLIGAAPHRVEGLLKVTGRALFGADQPLPDAVHMDFALAPIARGRVTSVDDTQARRLQGVCSILTWKDVGDAIGSGRGADGLQHSGYVSQAHPPLGSPEIHFAGQIIAAVVAETPQIAADAVQRLRFTFESSTPAGHFDSPGAEEVDAYAPLGSTSVSGGDVEAGLAAASTTVDAWYETPPQHHNPLELFQTSCAWSEDGQQLTVHESSQSVRGYQHGLALQLGLAPAQVRVVAPFIGGGFGSRGRLGQNTALAALAAKRLGRPVKHVARRRDGFTLRHYRAETRHHIRLGADAEGHLVALDHRSWELTSRDDTFAGAGSDSTSRLYACPNVHTLVRNVRADRQSPGFMRSPPETPYLFAMESAMDELAHALGIDPIELRRRNETRVDSITGRPYTSRRLLECIEEGARRFGWERRDARPGSHSTGTEHVGWGYATAFYPTNISPAEAAVMLTPDLRAVAETSTHEIGTGVRTVITQTVADLLGLPLEAVEARVGDTSLPAAPISAGSSGTASICTALYLACEQLRARLAEAATSAAGDPSSVLAGLPPDDVRLSDGRLVSGDASGALSEDLRTAVRRAGGGNPLVARVTSIPTGTPERNTARFWEAKPALYGGTDRSDRLQFSFGAQFVEVRIDRHTQMMSIPRMVGVFAAGRIMNRRTAWAQLNGSQIWGMSAVTHEATELDPRSARYVNRDFSEYHIPVIADVGDIQTVMLDEVDTLINPLGIKGLGELGMTGMNAAVANAVFHATGRRLRRLPIRPGDLLTRAGAGR